MSAKHQQPRRGRCILFWMLGSFFALQLAGGFLLEHVFPQVRFPFLYRQLALLDEQPRPPNIVFLGSSRFGCGLSGDAVTDLLHRLTGDPQVQAFNAAIPAGDLLVSELMLRQLLDRGVKPRFAVIEVCPEVLNHRNDWIKIHVARQIGWSDVPGYFLEITRTGNLLRLATDRFVPLYNHRETLCKQIGGGIEAALSSWLDADAAVETPRRSAPAAIDWDSLVNRHYRDMTSDQRQKTQIGLYDVRRCLRSYRAGGNSGAALERMLMLCKANDVVPILVGVPVSQPQRELYVRPIEESYTAFIADVTRRHGCRYFDMRHRVPDALFVDNHHADGQGCLLFSRILAEEVLAPLWVK